jgi:hypothetical protein
MFVSKGIHRILYMPVLKISLCRVPETNFRSFVWCKVLIPPTYNANYEVMLRLINSDLTLNKFDEVIHLDVTRSFKGNTDISAENLSNILRVYAFFNSEIGYC